MNPHSFKDIVKKVVEGRIVSLEPIKIKENMIYVPIV
jgi:hypothetical protein